MDWKKMGMLAAILACADGDSTLGIIWSLTWGMVFLYSLTKFK